MYMHGEIVVSNFSVLFSIFVAEFTYVAVANRCHYTCTHSASNMLLWARVHKLLLWVISSCLLPCLCVGCSSPHCTMWQWRGEWERKILGRSSSLEQQPLSGDWKMLSLHSTHVHYHSLCLYQPSREQWWAWLIGMGKVLGYSHQCSHSKRCSHCWRPAKLTKHNTE